MSDQTYTHKDLAELLGVSETTVKSYRRKFPECIPVASRGKPIRFTADAAPVALRIRDLFETGMSVDDVRGRLAAEFDWVSPESPASAATSGGKSSPRADVGPELSLGVSNMAKSMVAMTQQQKAILTRIQGLESLLEELGIREGQEGAARDAESLRESRAAAREREQALELRLNRIDEDTRELANNVRELSDQLARFLGQRARAAEAWQENGTAAMAQAAESAAEAVGARQPQAERQEHTGATVIPLRSGVDRSVQAAPPPPAAPAEPQRAFFALPLVVRTEEGRYVSAGGKSRGRFSLNDLKAMLIYGFTPPNHFSLRWESHGQGWWLFLEQEQGERAVHLLLMELPTQKGGSVAEILQVRHNGDTLHPAEICSIIDSFGA